MSARLRPGTIKKSRLFKFKRYYQAPTPVGGHSREQRREVHIKQSSWRRGLIGGLAVLAAIGLIYRFGLVRQAEVRGGLDQASAAEVQSLAEQYLRQHWYSRFKPLISPAKLAGSIELADSRFSGTVATVSLLGDKLVIDTQLRRPAARWTASGGSRTYLVDDTGVVYIDNEALALAGGLPLIEDASGLELVPGEQLASTSTLDFVQLLDELLSAEDIYVAAGRRYVLAVSPREIQLDVSGQPYRVKFIATRGAVDQVKELSAVLAHLKKTGITPRSYIDLRVDDTAYYR